MCLPVELPRGGSLASLGLGALPPAPGPLRFLRRLPAVVRDPLKEGGCAGGLDPEGGWKPGGHLLLLPRPGMCLGVSSVGAGGLGRLCPRGVLWSPAWDVLSRAA